ncbi:MAG TPA: ATP-dependent DNA ligase [Acidobacteriota bacterium]|nr:ATP-dependent DNA ligase [Acidobacteriota bacterium]
MRALALTLETISGHASTDAKVRSAAAYLASQEAHRVATAARFLAGAPLPPRTPATRVGRSTLIDLVAAFTGEDRRDLLRQATLEGDLGIAVGTLLEAHPRAPGPRLTLVEVATALQQLGEVGAVRRSQLLKGLLVRVTPIEAKYLVKLLLGSLRTGVQAARVEEAIALAFDQPPSAVRRAHMLLGDIGMAAEHAAAETLGDVSLQAQRPVRVMLAHSCNSAASVLEILRPPVVAEDKFDGIRAQMHIAPGEQRLYSRALEDFTHFFPELRAGIDGMAGEWILDGEVVAWLEDRCLSFATLQSRLGRKQVPLTLLLDAPVVFLAFDVLRANSKDLIDEPLRRRKEMLNALPVEGRVRRAPWELLQTEAEIGVWFGAAVQRGNEGAVFKDPESRYVPGTRGRSWAKLKRPVGTIDVVVTGAEWGRGKRAGMLSDLIFAVRGRDGLVDSGRAYSGLTDDVIRELTRRFRQQTLSGDGAIRRVAPEVVLEVAFDEVRRSHRHPSGFSLRFPRIVRRRVDLTPDDISTLEDLERLCDQGRGDGPAPP